MKSNRKYKRIIFIIAIVFIIMQFLMIMENNVYAQDPVTQKLKGIYVANPADDTGEIKLMLGNYLWIAMAIGMVTGVAMIAVIGIKFIISAPEGKAEIKKQAYMYLVGAVLIMLGSTFVGIIADVAYTVMNP